MTTLTATYDSDVLQATFHAQLDRAQFCDEVDERSPAELATLTICGVDLTYDQMTALPPAVMAGIMQLADGLEFEG